MSPKTSEPNPVSAHIRAHSQAIMDVWEELVRASLPQLETIDRSALVDHLPEFLDGLTRWIDGDTQAARSAFEILADGHAIQRLGYAIDLETLTAEYAFLRSALLHACLSVPTRESIREPLARLNEGMDQAINEAVRRYTRQRDQARDRFIGILAHDLRTPLNTIAMAAGNIASVAGIPEDKLQRAAETIVRSTERMARMIDDVITFARDHMGAGIPVTLRRGDLGEICRSVVEELRVGHPGREVTIECRGELDGVWDRDRVFQAISNVVGNALQHGLDPIRVLVEEADDKRSVRTIVTNQGQTIPPEMMATLFEPFTGGTPRTTGLGLGLYITRAIARAHGARCTIHSSDQRTEVRIDWPRVPLDETPNRPIVEPAA